MPAPIQAAAEIEQGVVRPLIINPSDLTFLWEECKRCTYNKVVLGLRRPSMPMPSIFNAIDKEMKACYQNHRTDEFAVGLPPGMFAYADEWVQSVPIPVTGCERPIVIKGRFDTVLALDDSTHCICDFKTSSPRENHIPLYQRQLNAYAMCLEHPAPREFGAARVESMGLIVFEPLKFKPRDTPGSSISGYFGGSINWIPMRRDDVAFMKLLAEMAAVLGNPQAPGSGPGCPYCKYLDDAERGNL